MPKLIHEAYDELMHYTSATGLHGIVTSGTLRATHYLFLNDLQEYGLFFEHRFPKLVMRALEKAVDECDPSNSFLGRVKQHGGRDSYIETASVQLVPFFAEHFRKFETPYVTCFSRVVPTESFIARNGLLSQWRGYGPDGGYAIVFKTEALSELMTEQTRHIKGMQFFGGDVEYFDNPSDDAPVHPETVENANCVVDAMCNFVRSPDPEAIAPAWQPATRLAILCKHGGFREEREVRYVISQPNRILVDAHPDEHKLLPVQHFVRGGTPVPYLSLFQFEGSPRRRLPITRVIVGPHRESAARKAGVELLLEANGYDAKVEISGIPYRGP
jgi:hypothetical protein